VKSALLLLVLSALPLAVGLAQGGPDLVDVRQYGARAVNAWWQYGTTVTGTAGSNQVIAASPSIFQNKDGIVIYGAGAAPAVRTPPAAPIIMPGISETETVPDAPLVPLRSGTASYSYTVVARDIRGGLSPASPVTTITNGPNKLGQNTIAISKLGLTGNVITVMTASLHGIVVGQHEGPLVHIKDSSNSEKFSGWWNVSGVTNPTAITIKGTSRNSARPVEARGGSLVYFTGNRITWTSQAGVWEYVVCARRPGDRSLHVIGVSMPSGRPVGGSYTVSSFIDWGAPLIGVHFELPAYINDAVCTATQPTNDYLSTLVVAGGETPTLTLKDKLANTVNGAKALVDATPGILAAAQVAQQNGQTLYIPGSGRGPSVYQINSTLDLPWSLDVLQVGRVRLGETIVVNPATNWRARGSAQSPAFAWKASPSIQVEEANPGLYLNGTGPGAIDFDSVTVSANEAANQALLLVVDNTWGSTFRYLNLTSGGPNDFSGIALVVRDSANTTLVYPSLLGGPDQVIDSTWTPLVYMAPSPTVSGSTGTWTIEHGMFNRRGILYRALGGNSMDCALEPGYIQGAITPFLAVQNTVGWNDPQIVMRRIMMDTSSQAFLALWNTGGQDIGGNVRAHVVLEGTNGMGVEASGGRPTLLTGVAPSELTSKNILGALGQ
jgi:hypothetical protein